MRVRGEENIKWSLTHHSPVLLIYTPWKTFKFSDVLSRYGKAIPGCKGFSKSWESSTTLII